MLLFTVMNALEAQHPPLTPREVIFYKLGGTWDMVEVDGALKGRGNLDDDELRRLEDRFGVTKFTDPLDLIKAEKDLAFEVYRRFQATGPEKEPVEEIIRSWCPDFGRYVTGPFVALYSGDSSHLRESLVAPMEATLLQQLRRQRRRKILGGKGTDTADIALLSLHDSIAWDVYVEDLTLEGSNQSHREWNSDAPRNFLNLGKIAYYDLTKLAEQAHVPGVGRSSGAYWGFQDYLYPAVDLVKIDPKETRKIEGHSTFYSPFAWAQRVDDLIQQQLEDGGWDDDLVVEYNAVVDGAPMDPYTEFNPKHPITASMEQIYDALCDVETVDLGDQTKIWAAVGRILSTDSQAVVLAAHSLGNVSNPIRAACVEATKRGKIIIAASRCLLGEVNKRYAGSILDANDDELGNTSQKIVSAHNFNKTTARSVAVRTLLEERLGRGKYLRHHRTQELMDRYSRHSTGIWGLTG